MLTTIPNQNTLEEGALWLTKNLPPQTAVFKGRKRNNDIELCSTVEKHLDQLQGRDCLNQRVLARDLDVVEGRDLPDTLWQKNPFQPRRLWSNDLKCHNHQIRNFVKILLNLLLTSTVKLDYNVQLRTGHNRVFVINRVRYNRGSLSKLINLINHVI